MPERIFMKLGMYIMSPEPIFTVYLINTFHQSVCLYVYLPIVATQLFGENISAAKNTYATIEELLGASFSTRYVSCQRIVGD
jgi:hypothetical protein